MHPRGQMLFGGEHYHVFNRGAHKGIIFSDSCDYARFLVLLYLANNLRPIHISNLVQTKYRSRPLLEMLREETDRTLVDVFAYTLMPDHFHLILRQKIAGGIEKFMRKLSTGYSMYFNTKYGHTGVLFQGRYKSSHIDSEAYFRYIFASVHLDPVDLAQPDWKRAGLKDRKCIRTFLSAYPYSSYRDYCAGNRPERKILAREDLPDFLKDQNGLEELLKWGSGSDIPVFNQGPFSLEKLGKTS